MPSFIVEHDTNICPVAEPWAVTNKETGKLHGCHPSQEHARKQQAALYMATGPDASKMQNNASAADETRVVKEENGRWYVYSKDGTKRLGGPYATKAEAVKRLGQIEYFKQHSADTSDVNGRMQAVDTTMYPEPAGLAGQYEPANIEELQGMIAELASNPGVHQNSNQGHMQQIIQKLKAAAARLNAQDLIPPAWHPTGTIFTPRRSPLDYESRLFSLETCELRDKGNGLITLAGYASTFNDPYPVRDKYGEFDETILPGAWARTIANRGSKIHLKVAHGDEPIPLANSARGTLRMWEDSHGLGFEGDLVPEESPLHKTVAVAVQRGDMDEMSVGMRVPSGGDLWTENNSRRSISEAALIEISVVSRGANGNTQAALRAEQLLAENRWLRSQLDKNASSMVTDAARQALRETYLPSRADIARRALLDLSQL